MTKPDNTELSFGEMPLEQQVKLLLLQNQTLQNKLDTMTSQFERYEKSDQKLLMENASLKARFSAETDKSSKTSKLSSQAKLIIANTELERLRRVIDEMGGHPDVTANNRSYAGIVRIYLRHHGMPIDEFKAFVAYMSRGQNPNPVAYFEHQSATNEI